jgi:hypothetical protein
LNRSTDLFEIRWSTSDPQGLLPEMFKFANIQDGCRMPAAIFQTV